MTVLRFQAVWAGHRDQPDVLRDTSFELRRGELAAVWGVRRSGKTTLLRVAAGLVRPSRGVVLLEGQPVRERSATTGWFDPTISTFQAGSVAEHVAVPLLPRRVPARQAVRRARDVLRRLGVEGIADAHPPDLKPVELVYAGIARALVTAPALLLVDEPTGTVGMLEGDPIFETLRSIADEGVAVLATIGVGEDAPLAHRQFTLEGGGLRDVTGAGADIVPIR